MNKKLIVIVLMLVFGNFLMAQDNKNIYDSEKDAKLQLEEAIKTANAEGKQVLIQIGNNNRPWCIKVHEFYTADAELDSIINENYVLVFINCSKENRNLEVMQTLDMPQRFGFPVFVVLDSTGKRLHTQDSLYLESKKSYNKDYIKRFLQAWTVKALAPENNK